MASVILGHEVNSSYVTGIASNPAAPLRVNSLARKRIHFSIFAVFFGEYIFTKRRRCRKKKKRTERAFKKLLIYNGTSASTPLVSNLFNFF